MSYVVLAGLWIIWCLIHSGMIWVTVTDALKRRWENYFRFFLFSLLNVLGTLLLYAPSSVSPSHRSFANSFHENGK
jgi:hypothetical protein